MRCDNVVLGKKHEGILHAQPALSGGNSTESDRSKEEKLRKRNLVLVSEMDNTNHQWPWPETVKVFKKCAEKKWTPISLLPEVSVIISFHNNENIFNILHTLHAIVKHTPSQLLREIILIDDNSHKDEFCQILKFHIDEFVNARVQLVRSNSTLGLIRARLNGIKLARAPVVIVMDSHVEPQPGWLVPLLHEIKLDGRTLATPYLDWMQKFPHGWQYRHGACSWKTYFDWTLTFGFQALSPKVITVREANPTAPVASAVTVGTVWAMEKAWFEEVGAFDEDMQLWGGENIDLGVRVWLFGGRVVNVPCSHVAHLESVGGRDYRNSWSEIIHTNYKRFAEVWMDDYKEYFYQHIPEARNLNMGDITSRLTLKSRALHNFTWFLTNILPELGRPDVGSMAWGGLEVVYDGRLPRCLDSLFSFSPQITLCNPRAIATQGYYWTMDGLIRLPIHILNHAGEAVVSNEYTSYHNTGQATVWFHTRNGPIIETKSGLCMEMTAQNTVILTKCEDKPQQRWRFMYYSADYDRMMLSHQSNVQDFSKYLRQTKHFQITTRAYAKLSIAVDRVFHNLHHG